jgi:hypothetical protein
MNYKNSRSVMQVDFCFFFQSATRNVLIFDIKRRKPSGLQVLEL